MLLFALHRYRTSVCTSTRETPFFVNIKHEGLASCGGRSPVNESPDESQACLNLNTRLPCVLDSYTRRG